MRKRWISLLAAVLLAANIEVLAVAQDGGVQPPPSLYAEAAILLDAESGQILYQKNPHEKLYPASITKIMTCLLAMEEGTPTDTVTVTDEGAFAVPRNTTHIALTGGEKLTLEQLEYAMMVQSANDAANAIAIHLAGSIEDFAKKMNAKAAALGATDTQFTNANGLPDPGHYTSAYDMGLFVRAAFAYPAFRSLAGTQKYEIPPTNKQKDTRYLANNQYMFTLNETYPGAFAGKTGWTEEAGHTLVTIAEQNEVTLICIVLHSDAKGVFDCQYKDSTALLDYGFQNFGRTYFPGNAFEPRQVRFTDQAGQEAAGTLRLENDLPLLLPAGATVAEVAVAEQIPARLDAQAGGQAAVKLTLKNPPNGMPEELGIYPLTLEREQPLAAAAASGEKAWWQKSNPFKWIGVAAAMLLLALLVVRQVVRAHYKSRNKRRLHSRKQRRLPPAKPQTLTPDLVDVTAEKDGKPKIKVIDIEEL